VTNTIPSVSISARIRARVDMPLRPAN
jgi:hypothetical protein